MGPELMLATPTTLPVEMAAASMTAQGLWAVELKLDGIRAAVTLRAGQVTITNRNGVDITYRYPDVVEALAGLGLTAVLDGEIIVEGARGRPDFTAVHRRDAQATPRAAAELARTHRAVFVAFDVLSMSGIDVRGLAYAKRRHRLEQLETSGPLRINVSRDDGGAMWEFVVMHDLEGLVLKRKDSIYVGRRSPSWVKVKAIKRVSALVCGWEPGRGYLEGTFGALKVALIDDNGAIEPVGSVGSGFSDADRRLIWERIQRGDHPIIVEVNYHEVSPNGRLRHPSFQGVRSDIDATDCTFAQLTSRNS